MSETPSRRPTLLARDASLEMGEPLSTRRDCEEAVPAPELC